MILILKGNVETKTYNLLVLLMLSKIYKCDFRIIWKVHSSDTCQLQLHDIFTDPLFKKRVMTQLQIQHDKTYYYNHTISLKHLLLMAIPQNQIDLKTTSYKNTPVVLYDYYIMNKYDDFIPDVLDWIIPTKVFREELKLLQTSLRLNPNIEGFFNVYKKKRHNQNVIGVYIGRCSHRVDILQACVQKMQDCMDDELRKNKRGRVLFYISFDDTHYRSTQIRNALKYFETEFRESETLLLYFNHLQGEGNLYSVMNMLCLQDSDILLIASEQDEKNRLKLLTLQKGQCVFCV